MKLIKFSKVLSVNNEIQVNFKGNKMNPDFPFREISQAGKPRQEFDKLNISNVGHSAKNLLRAEIDAKKGWLCEKGTQRGIVFLELECPTVITAVRIGNAHSAFVEVLVGNVGDPTDKYRTLIPPSLFMNCYDAKSGTNPDQVKFFYRKDLSPAVCGKEWSALQIVCTQPFNDKVPFGICFVRVTGLGDELQVAEEKKEEEEPKAVPSASSKETPVKEERKLTMAEEILKAGKSSTRMKAASIKSKASSEGKIRRKDVDDKGAPDKRGNKNFGPEQTRKKRKKSPEEKASPDNKKDGSGESRRKRRRGPTGSPPFSRLMDDVTFVISGFKNPERSDIRNLALSMGAEYSSDWNSRCSHLICSYVNTPKYNEVKGKGKIVRKDWVLDCHKDRKRYPWRRYALDPDDSKAEESEEEVPAGEADSSEEEKEKATAAVTERTGRRSTRRKPQEKKQAQEDGDTTETDEEQKQRTDTTELPMPFLPDFLSGKTFYVDPNLDNCDVVERYIVAYNGNIAGTVEEGVEFYVTEKGGDVLGIFRKKVPKIRAVRPSWIWEINSKGQWVSPWKFMISA